MKMIWADRNRVRMAALLLCGVIGSGYWAVPSVAQSVTTGAGTQDPMPGPPPGGVEPGGQGGMRRGGGPEQRLERMQKELNLSADQTAKVKAILENGRAEMMAGRDSTASQEDRRAKMMSMMQTENAKIKAVLTDDQKVKYEAMQDRQRERMRDGRRKGSDGPPPPPPPPAPPAPPAAPAAPQQ